MIVQTPTEGFEETLIHTKSDLGLPIRQVETGLVYIEADDIVPCPYTYEEVQNGSDLND